MNTYPRKGRFMCTKTIIKPNSDIGVMKDESYEVVSVNLFATPPYVFVKDREPLNDCAFYGIDTFDWEMDFSKYYEH